MATVRELITRLSFKTDTNKVKRYEKSIATLKTGLKRLTIATAAVNGVTFGFGAALAKIGDDLATTATEVGLTTKRFQELSFALSQVAGVTKEETERALGRLNQRIGRAEQGNEQYQKSLMAIGFTQQQINAGNITAEQAFRKLTKRMGEAKDSTEAAAVAGDLLGTRIGRRLGPALQQNSAAVQAAVQDYRALGDGFSNAAVVASSNFMEAMGRVGAITKTAAGDLAERLLPVLTKIVSGFVDWWKANRAIIKQNVNRFLDNLVTALRLFFAVTSEVASAVNKIIQIFGGWKTTIETIVATFAAFQALKLIKFMRDLVLAFDAAAIATGGLRAAVLLLSRTPIILAITGLILVIQDLITWLHGGKSAFGSLLKGITEFSALAIKAFERLENTVKPIFDFFSNSIGGMIDELNKGINVIGKFIGKAASAVRSNSLIGRALGNKTIRQFVGVDPSPDSANPQQNLSRGVDPSPDSANPQQNLSRGVDPSPDSANPQQNLSRGVASNMQQINGRDRHIQVTAKTEATLQVPEGTPDQQRQNIAKQAKEIFKQHWDEQLRRANWDVQPQE